MQGATADTRQRRRYLIDSARLRTLNQRIDRRGLGQSLGHLALILATATLVALAHSVWLLPALVAHGIALVSLFAPLHEASHRTVFHSRWPHRALVWLSGLVLVLPPTWFRQFHLEHHRHAQDPARDPELAEPKPGSIAGYAWVISGVPFWRNAVVNLARLARGRFAGMDYVAARERPAVQREACIFVAVYALLVVGSITFASAAVLVYWLVPVLLGQPFLRAFLLAEHTGCSEGGDGLTNTRTTLTSAPVRMLMWNMSFHAEHHLYPSVPFHALPALHRDIRNNLGVVAPGYPAAHRDIRAGLHRARAPQD